MNPTERLRELGLTLPPVPAPAAAYRPHQRAGSLVFTAGQLPFVDGALPVTGKLGADLTVEEGMRQARAAGLNALAAAAEGGGGLERIRIVKITVFVASAHGFVEQHLVANGATHVLSEILGDHGTHARSAVGVGVLPFDAPVEVEIIAEMFDA